MGGRLRPESAAGITRNMHLILEILKNLPIPSGHRQGIMERLADARFGLL
jgi:hypothetical protein